jgi:hypothetical protein
MQSLGGTIPGQWVKCITASATETKQEQFKRLKLMKNLEGWPKWEILVSDQTTKITEVNFGHAGAFAWQGIRRAPCI